MEKIMNEEEKRQAENKVYRNFYKMLDDQIYKSQQSLNIEMVQIYRDIKEKTHIMDGTTNLAKFFDNTIKQYERLITYQTELYETPGRLRLMESRIEKAQRQLAYAIALEILLECMQDAYE